MMSKAGSEGWLGSLVQCKALQLVCSQADAPVMQEWLMNMLLGTMSLGVLHCCTGFARGLHRGHAVLVTFNAMCYADLGQTDFCAGACLRV